jgi:hypothetical protein
VLTTANAAGTNGLTCLPKHGGNRDNKFLVTHPITHQRCLTSAIARRGALTVGPTPSAIQHRIILKKRLIQQTRVFRVLVQSRQKGLVLVGKLQA